MKKQSERRSQWLRGLEALQCGLLKEAADSFVAEGKRCEDMQHWARAAIAWRTAAATMGRLGDVAEGTLLLRRSAIASLAWAEGSEDPRHMREGFLEATRAFLTLGDLEQAKRSLDLAISLESTLADDPQTVLLLEPESCASA